MTTEGAELAQKRPREEDDSAGPVVQADGAAQQPAPKAARFVFSNVDALSFRRLPLFSLFRFPRLNALSLFPIHNQTPTQVRRGNSKAV